MIEISSCVLFHWASSDGYFQLGNFILLPRVESLPTLNYLHAEKQMKVYISMKFYLLLLKNIKIKKSIDFLCYNWGHGKRG